jgi:hypothetical protein
MTVWDRKRLSDEIAAMCEAASKGDLTWRAWHIASQRPCTVYLPLGELTNSRITGYLSVYGRGARVCAWGTGDGWGLDYQAVEGMVRIGPIPIVDALLMATEVTVYRIAVDDAARES